MFVADAHCDTLYKITIEKRTLDRCHVNEANLRAGGVGMQTYAIFAAAKGMAGTPYEDAKRMLENTYRLGVPILRKELPDTPPTEPTGVLSCEGAEMFAGSLDKLAEFDNDSRLRMIALTWNHENQVAWPASSGSDEKLKPFGREFLQEMDRRGILADVSHLNDAGFWDVCERAALPPIASHSDCRWLCEQGRNLTKDMAKAIIERKGFIGINFYSGFLNRENATMDDVVRHIDALMELGGEDVIGFGSDFDGINSWPEGLADPSDFPKLLKLLSDQGYSQLLLEKIAGLNLWNLLKRTEASRAV